MIQTVIEDYCRIWLIIELLQVVSDLYIEKKEEI